MVCNPEREDRRGRNSTVFCLFPTIRNTDPAYESYEEETVELRPDDNPRVFPGLGEGQFRDALSAAWGVVLHLFGEADVIRFGYHAEIKGDTEGLTSGVLMQTFNGVVDQDAPVSQFLRKENWELSLAKDFSLGSFNSGLFFVQEVRANTEHRRDLQASNKLYGVNLIAETCRQKREVKLVYVSSLLSRLHAHHLANVVSKALTFVLCNPNQRVRDIDLCCPLQKQQISKWQRKLMVDEETRFMFQHLYRKCIRQPNAVAVKAEDGSLTYKELDDISSRLAVHLQQQGVGSEVVVPICFEKTRWAITAMFAINKAGGAFLPCDPSHPMDRIRELVKTTNSKIAMTSLNHARFFSRVVDEIIVISDQTVERDFQNSTSYTSPEDWTSTAYCLSTSGSTGKPKLCRVGNSAFASISSHTDALHLGSETRVLQFATFSFGISLIEIFCTLCAGGTVCMPSDNDRINALPAAITSMGVNWAMITPTVLASIRPQDVPTLDILLIAGEPLGEPQVKLWASEVQLFQAFGFTEWSGICTVSQRLTSLRERKNIGAPANANIWLVDPVDHNKLAPIGGVGELVVQGPSLACGYYSGSEKLNSNFLSNPAWLQEFQQPHHNSGLLYKTGDIVKYNEHGGINYIRRKDNQVKIRGQRLELNEVEYHTLRLFPNSKRVVATVLQDADNVDQVTLVMFVLLHTSDDKNIDSREKQSSLDVLSVDNEFKSTVQKVKESLRSRLPEVMVPELFIPLSTIPTTITGKVDRQALRTRANKFSRGELYSLLGVRAEMRGPATNAEAIVHRIACEVLKLPHDRLGLLDDFFHVGGNSVAAMRLVASARRQGLQLQVSDVFKHPVLVDLASTVLESSRRSTSELQPFQLLDVHLLDTIKKTAMDQCQVTDGEIDDIYPCTDLQEALVALSLKMPQSFRARFIYQLNADVNIEKFRSSWEKVVEANNILRTRFIIGPSNRMFQAVTREGFEWDHGYDLRTYTDQIDQQPVGIGTSLVRACLLVENNQRNPSTFVLTIHHALCDRWSMDLIMEQLESAYKGYLAPKIPFNAFIKYLPAANSHAVDYWVSQFQGLTAKPFLAIQPQTYIPTVDKELEFVIKLPCRQAGSHTIPTYIYLAWAMVVSHNTCSDDIVYGVTVTGRAVAIDNIEQIVGPTIATIPLRIRLRAGQTVLDALSELQDQTITRIPFEHLGLQQIQRCSPETKLACQFQSHLIIQPTRPHSSTLFSTRQEGPASSGGFSTYGLTLECQLNEDDTKASVTATFDSNIISFERTQRLLQHLELTLDRMLSNPYEAIEKFPHISPHDLEQLITWNSAVPEKSVECIHEVVYQRCLESPDSPAVDAWDGKFTYLELENSANTLAVELINRGTRHQTIVPLLFEKCKWTTVAMLAVMKAGAAFVVLDPSHPAERIKLICQTIGAGLIICSEEHSKLAARLTTQIVTVHQNASWWVRSIDKVQLPTFIRPGDAAYVAFTSGSTGKPKGVIIEHGSYCSAAEAHNPLHQINKRSRVLQFSSYAFDISIVETMSTLMAGGCVCVISEFERMNDIARAATKMGATHASFTPTFARTLTPHKLPSVQTIILGGEPLSTADLSRWKDRVTLISEYGMAECCGISLIQPQVPADTRNVGYSVAAGIWLVDHRDPEFLVPIGTTGELIIEGPTVGRCYVGNPDQTGNAFIEPPNWLRTIRKGAPHRVYRTGDLFQYNQDGSLRFVGRRDTQIKLRGQRLELGEVEHQLWQHFSHASDIAAVVAAPQDNESRMLLVGFIAAGSGTSSPHSNECIIVPYSEEFQHLSAVAEAKLREILPDFMVPSILLQLQYMPRTGNGKVDTRRLILEINSRALAELRKFATRETKKRQPSVEAERVLQGIWAQVLNLPTANIGMDDGFFQLGGDSITAMQAVANASSKRLSHSAQDIFRLGTISKIVKHALEVPMAPVQAKPVYEDNQLFRLSPIQQFFFSHYPNGHNRWSQNILLHPAKTFAYSDIKQALIKLVGEHAMLRARFLRGPDGGWLQHIAENSEGCFNCKYHRISSENYLEKIIEESQNLLNICSGPVFSADVIEVGNKQSIFLAGHHLVLDLVSWRIIVADLEGLLSNNRISSEKSTTFQEWCYLLSGYARRNISPQLSLEPKTPEDQRTIEDFWGISDFPNTYGNSLDTIVEIDRETTYRLLGPANRAFNTQPADLLHAAILFSFLQTFPHRSVPQIFNEAHGREPWDRSTDLSRTVGWFTVLSQVVATADVSGDILGVVQTVKDCRHNISREGWHSFTSIYHSTIGGTVARKTLPIEIIFNFAGQFQQFERSDAFFRVEPPHTRKMFDAASDIERFSIFDINIFVIDHKLQFHLTFPGKLNQKEVLKPWLQNLKNTLCEMTMALIQAQRRYTLSDFPSLSLTYNGLSHFLQTLSKVGIPMENIEGAYPCTSIQQGILLSQAKNAAYYSISNTWEVISSKGLEVSVNRVKSAWKQVIARHSILRTLFVESSSPDAYFDQIVLGQNCDCFIQISETDQNLCETCKGIKRFPYSLTIYNSEGRNVVSFRLDVNHALLDAKSFLLLERDFRLAYDGELNAQAPQYSDYVSYCQRQDKEAGAKFWAEYLHDSQPCIFPMLDPLLDEAPTQSYGIQFKLSTQREIEKYSKSRNVTPTSIFCMAWSFVLRYFTGQDNVCFGNLLSTRELPTENASDIVGPLMNTVTCFVNFKKHTVAELVQKIHTDYASSLAYSTFSLAEVSQIRGLAGGALFNTVISIQQAGGEEEALDLSTRLKLVEKNDPTEFHITLNIAVEKECTVVDLRYWNTLSHDQAAIIGACFEKAILQILEDDSILATNVDLFSSADARFILRWNKDCPPTSKDCVHSLIEERAIETPDSVAVCGCDGAFTYSELDGLSTSLATHLRTLGVGVGSFVPVCFEKSCWTVVAMLGAVKAGAAFILLDPSHPKKRLENICRDGNCQLVLSSEGCAELCGQLCAQVVLIGKNQHNWDHHGANCSPPTICHQDALCVVFTSGSTGKPKGAILEHGGFCTTVQSFSPVFKLDKSSRMVQFSSYAFDVSIFEILATLMTGGCVCVLSEVERRDFFTETVDSLKATHAILTPSFARLIPIPNSLKLLILMGEAVTKADKERWVNQLHLLNGYGPAECSVFSHAEHSITGSRQSRSIGNSTACTSWIVDTNNHHKLVSVGVVGELMLEGPIVGRGYLNDDERTAATFVAPPRWAQEFRPKLGGNNKFYKTGDLVRYDVNGSLHHMGRKDTQIKLRGQRIELGEVEVNIQRCFAEAKGVIVEVAVVADTPMLVAFLWLGSNVFSSTEARLIAEPDDDFRSRLLSVCNDLYSILPSFMVPSFFIPLVRIPYNSSGKTDRRRLRESIEGLGLEDLSIYRPSSYERREPSTRGESILQRIWASTLALPLKNIGADDNFFQVGGDSVSAMKVAALARLEGMEVTVADIFKHPKLSELSKAHHSPKPAQPSKCPSPFSLSPVKDVQKFSLSLSQQGILPETSTIADILPASEVQNFFLQRKTFHHFSFILRGKVDVDQLHSACNAVFSRHSILRTVFTVYNGRCIQIVLDNNIPVPFHAITTDQDLKNFCDSLWATYSKAPAVFDKPIYNVFLVSDLESVYHTLVFQLSHAQWDGLSTPELFNDIASVYNGQQLSPTTQFTEYIYNCSTQEHEKSFDFWREYLLGSTMTKLVDIPPLSTTELDHGATIWENVDLKPVPVTPTGITMATMVKASWCLVMAEYTAEMDLVFGQTVNARSLAIPNVDKILGPCLNFIPVRAKINPTWTIRDLLDYVQEQYQLTVRYDYLELSTIVENCTAWPKDSHFGAIVQHQNVTLHHSLQLDGLETSYYLNASFRPSSEIFIFSEPYPDKLSVQFCANPNIIDIQVAKKLLERLCGAILACSRSPERTIDSFLKTRNGDIKESLLN